MRVRRTILSRVLIICFGQLLRGCAIAMCHRTLRMILRLCTTTSEVPSWVISLCPRTLSTTKRDGPSARSTTCVFPRRNLTYSSCPAYSVHFPQQRCLSTLVQKSPSFRQYSNIHGHRGSYSLSFVAATRGSQMIAGYLYTTRLHAQVPIGRNIKQLVRHKPLSVRSVAQFLPGRRAPCRKSRIPHAASYWTTTEAQSGISISALAFGLATSVAVALVWSYDYKTTSENSSLTNTTRSVENAPVVRASPGMSPSIPAGRPGNLTPEQETKLKELWEALLKLTEAFPSDSHANGDAASISPSKSSFPESPDNSSKKRRRFGSLLGKKSKHEEVQSDSASIADSIGDDKHGLGKEFKAALASQTPEQLRENLWGFTKGDDPDALLLRYLRARKWDVQAALIMLIATIRWRADTMRLDTDIMRQGETGAIAASKGQPVVGMDQKLGQEFMSQLRMGKSFLHGVDKDGRPICYVRVRLHRAADQSEAALERYTVWTIETARLMLRPPIDTAVIVFDMTSFSLSNMDYTPVKFMIKVFEANYPESLGAVLVHKSPWLFSSIWSIIRGWLDPVVASKVHFTKDAKDLMQFIPRENIPRELGGEEDWSYEYVEPKSENDGESRLGNEKELRPLLEERHSLFSEYQKETIKWCTDESGSAKESPQKRLDLAEKIRQNYWRLDPYLRASSLYDRTGVIKEGGQVDFYPTRHHHHHNDNAVTSNSNDNNNNNNSNNKSHRSALKVLEDPPRLSSDSAGEKSIYYDALD